MATSFAISATYKAPTGHNRLTDVTLSVMATLTCDHSIEVDFGDVKPESEKAEKGVSVEFLNAAVRLAKK